MEWARDGLLLLFRCSVVSDYLGTHGLQHASLPCPSLSPGICSSSCPLSWWCHPTILSSVFIFFSCPQSFPALGLFQWVSQLFASGGQIIGASASASDSPMNIQDSFPLGLTGLISLLFKELSRVFSSTTIRKQRFFGTQLSIRSNSHIHIWLLENHSFDYTDFGRQSNVSSFYFIFFNFIYFNWRLVTLQYCIGFVIYVCNGFPSKEEQSFNFMAPITICSDFGAPKNKVWHCFPMYLSWSDGTWWHDLCFLNVEL